jgi:AcrR family transcriptional regulator
MGAETQRSAGISAKSAAAANGPRAEHHAVSRIMQLIDAAEQVFLEKGFHAATMSDVAKAAGMSKKTVYQLIESKDDLFAALLTHHQGSLAMPVYRDDMTVRDMLIAHLIACSHFILAAKNIAIMRLIMAEHIHSPELGRMFHQKFVMKTKARMESFFKDLAARNSVKSEDAKEMSAMLFGMAIGEFALGALIGFRGAPTKAALERRIRNAVDLFLAGYGAGGWTFSKT